MRSKQESQNSGQNGHGAAFGQPAARALCCTLLFPPRRAQVIHRRRSEQQRSGRNAHKPARPSGVAGCKPSTSRQHSHRPPPSGRRALKHLQKPRSDRRGSERCAAAGHYERPHHPAGSRWNGRSALKARRQKGDQCRNCERGLHEQDRGSASCTARAQREAVTAGRHQVAPHPTVRGHGSTHCWVRGGAWPEAPWVRGRALTWRTQH